MGKQISLKKVIDLRQKPYLICFCSSDFLESVLDRISQSDESHGDLRGTIVEELLFRKLISSINSSFDLKKILKG